MHFRIYHIICFTFLLNNSLFSQNSEYIKVSKSSQVNGLSSYNIKRIIQDKNGFIWIATQGGISRYDGMRFLNYTKNSIERYRLGGSDIRGMLEDTLNNLIWNIPTEGAATAINITTGEVVKSIPSLTSQKDGWNMSLILNKRALWVGSFNGIRIIETKTGKQENLDLNGLKSTGVSNRFETRSLFNDEYGNVWAGISGLGICVFNGETKKIITQIPLNYLMEGAKLEYMKFFTFCKINNKKKILIGTSVGLRSIEYDSAYNITVDNRPCKIFPWVNNGLIESVRTDYYENIFVSGNSNLYKFNSSFTSYTILNDILKNSESDWLKAVTSIFFDKKNNMWLGCQQGLGFCSSEKTPFLPVTIESKGNMRLFHVQSLNPLSRNIVLAGLRNSLVKVNLDDMSFKVLLEGHGLCHHTYMDNKGIIEAYFAKGISLFKDDKTVPLKDVYPKFIPYKDYSFNSHCFLNDSILVLGTENDRGIIAWDIKNNILKNIIADKSVNSLYANTVNTVYKAKDKSLWVLSDKSINVYGQNLEKIKNLVYIDTVSKEPLNIYFDICEANNYLWIAAYGTGIIQLDYHFKIKKIWSSRQGLCDDGVYKLFSIGDSVLYITTNNGLSAFNIRTEKFKNYYKSDGLHSNAFEEACGVMKDGLIYAGGVDGFTIVDPTKFSTNKAAPQIYINRILVQSTKVKIDTSNLAISRLTIPDDVLQTTLYFSGINWSNPDRTVFAWRIIERSNEWSNIGTQNFITLIGLEHGTYHFQFKAGNEDGVWSEPKELVLKFLPKWYQTRGFYLLITLVIAAILYALYRYRIAQIEKQHEIRKSIATDLHDDLGSTLNSVKVFTNLAISGVKQEESLQQVKDNLTEATMSLRDMIWVLDDSLDTVDELITRLKQFAIPVAGASNIEAGIKADSEVNSRQLTKEEKRNLFLICKEAINNSIKYAGANQIDVAITASGKKIQIVVADNGKGFNVDEVKKGYGLKNMHYRAGQIKYWVTLNSSPGNGTQITINPQ